MKRSFFLAFSLFSFFIGVSQYSKDICSDIGVVGCSDGGEGGYYPSSSLEINGGFYTTPNNSMPFWVAAKSVETNLIDTTFSTSVLFELIDGPGELNGTLSFGSFLGYQYIDDWSFTQPGSYRIKMIMLGTKLDTINLTVVYPIDFCDPGFTNGCNDDEGDSIVFFRSSIVSVDAVFPITAGMVSRETGYLDTTWTGVVNLTQLNGPGTLWGTKHIEGGKWVMFVDLRVDAVGVYEVELGVDGSTGVYKDTLSFEAVSPSAITDVRPQKLMAFPNPISDIVNIQNPAGNSVLRVYSTDGKLVYAINNVNSGLVSLDFSHLSKGIYSLQIVSFEGVVFETRLLKSK